MSKYLIRCGFTLMELLVVISIIVVLASLLLPAVATARAAANKVKCLSNIKQVGTVLMVYSDDNRGQLIPLRVDHALCPPGWSRYSSKSGSRWIDPKGIGQVASEIREDHYRMQPPGSYWECPVTRKSSDLYASYKTNWGYGASWETFPQVREFPAGSGMASVNYNWTKVAQAVWSRINRPSLVPILSDCGSDWTWQNYGTCPGSPVNAIGSNWNDWVGAHRGGANLFFADMHGRWSPNPSAEAAAGTIKLRGFDP